MEDYNRSSIPAASVYPIIAVTRESRLHSRLFYVKYWFMSIFLPRH